MPARYYIYELFCDTNTDFNLHFQAASALRISLLKAGITLNVERNKYMSQKNIK